MTALRGFTRPDRRTLAAHALPTLEILLRRVRVPDDLAAVAAATGIPTSRLTVGIAQSVSREVVEGGDRSRGWARPVLPLLVIVLILEGIARRQGISLFNHRPALAPALATRTTVEPYHVLASRDLVTVLTPASTRRISTPSEVLGRYALRILPPGTLLRPTLLSASPLPPAAPRTVLAIPAAEPLRALLGTLPRSVLIVLRPPAGPVLVQDAVALAITGAPNHRALVLAIPAEAAKAFDTSARPAVFVDEGAAHASLGSPSTASDPTAVATAPAGRQR